MKKFVDYVCSLEHAKILDKYISGPKDPLFYHANIEGTFEVCPAHVTISGIPKTLQESVEKYPAYTLQELIELVNFHFYYVAPEDTLWGKEAKDYDKNIVTRNWVFLKDKYIYDPALKQFQYLFYRTRRNVCSSAQVELLAKSGFGASNDVEAVAKFLIHLFEEKINATTQLSNRT